MEFLTEPKIWVAVATLIFVIIAIKPAKKAILSAIDNYVSNITKKLAEAESLKKEAEALLENIKKVQAKSAQEADAIVNLAKQEAEAIIAEANKKLEADIETRKKMALQKISSYEEAATKEIKNHISKLAVEVSRKLLVDNINADVSKNIISGSIEKLSKTLH